MGGDKIMNPVLKMRKKQKEKEREKRREIKRAKKANEREEDELDGGYNPNNINELKESGKIFDKNDKEHYQQRPLTWQDLDSNLKTGTINRAVNDSYGYYSGIVNTDNDGQNAGYGGNMGGQQRMNGANNRYPPRWQGDSLTSQPMLYNQPPAPPPVPSLTPIEPPKKLENIKDKKRFMQDEFDPMNPHNAGKNFMRDIYNKEQKEEITEEQANEELEKVKSDFDQIKESVQEKKSNFVPAALRKRKPKSTIAPQNSAQSTSTTAPSSILVPSITPLSVPKITSKSSSPEPSSPEQTITSISIPSIVPAPPKSQNNTAPAKPSAKTTSALDSLLSMY